MQPDQHVFSGTFIETSSVGFQVFISRVDFAVPPPDVVAYFQQFGAIIRWNFPRSPNVKHYRHRGYGFLHYQTAEGQQRACKFGDGAVFHGRAVRVKVNNQGASHYDDQPPNDPDDADMQE